MKIAFVGKGGSGKTTLSSLFIRHLAAARVPVIAVDADINQHLATALGMDEAERRAAGPRCPAAAGQGLPARHQPAYRVRRDNDQDDTAR